MNVGQAHSASDKILIVVKCLRNCCQVRTVDLIKCLCTATLSLWHLIHSKKAELYHFVINLAFPLLRGSENSPGRQPSGDPA